MRESGTDFGTIEQIAAALDRLGEAYRLAAPADLTQRIVLCARPAGTPKVGRPSRRLLALAASLALAATIGLTLLAGRGHPQRATASGRAIEADMELLLALTGEGDVQSELDLLQVETVVLEARIESAPAWPDALEEGAI